MPFTTLSLGLTLTVPTSGTKNWGPTLQNTTWTKISNHNHTGSGDGNQMITSSYSDYSITLAKLSKGAGFFQYATPLVPSGTTQAIDWVNGSIQVLNVGSASGDVTITAFNNPQAAGRYTLFIIQGATPRDVIWPASVKWPQAQKPILSVGSGDIDKVDLYFDGTNYFGSWDLAFA